MIFETKLVYLIEALVIIASNPSRGAIRGTEICKILNLPERYLESEFQNLVHSGILKSIRGPKGGYVLAKEKRNISLLDLNKSIAREKSVSNFSVVANSVILPKLSEFEGQLAKVTLHDIIQDGVSKNLLKPAPSDDFTI